MTVGLNHRFGWTVIVFAGIVSMIPDFDGLPMLIDMSSFESGHRVWGHNFLAILASSAVLAYLQFRFRFIESVAGRIGRFAPQDVTIPTLDATQHVGFLPLFIVAFAFQSLHLVCDMVVSGGRGLSDWKVEPFWPFADVGFVLPLVPWGDVGPTLIMMCATILMARVPSRSNVIAGSGLVTLAVYMLLRGVQRGTIF